MKRKYSIAYFQKLARERGGYCLSTEYLGYHTKMTWRCSNGHVWDSTPASVIARNSWCARCSKKRVSKALSSNLEVFKKLAIERGGLCISDHYTNAHHKLLWECSNGHQWQASPNSVKRGSWCPVCSGRVVSLDYFIAIAEERGGSCLSTVYGGAKEDLEFKYSQGHIWKTAATNIQSGRWCPVCAGNLKRSLDDLKCEAQKRGGALLSSSYVNAHSKLEWKCFHEHIWKASWNQIQSGKWCPECSTGLGERICRSYFEQLFNRKFPKRHPSWLKSKMGTQLELDSYCEELGIAFEHHGMQHYERTDFFQSPEKFKRRQELDKQKEDLCRNYGVTLIVVPELFTLTKLQNLKEFIVDHSGLIKNEIRDNMQEVKIDLREAYIGPTQNENLEELRELAFLKGGKLNSENYLGNAFKLEWECDQGHSFLARPGNVKTGHWCPVCAGNLTLTLTLMKEIAKKGVENVFPSTTPMPILN